MEIHNQPSDGRAHAMRFDVTKPMRDVVQQRQPLAPEEPTPEEVAAEAAAKTKAPKDPATIERARDEHRAAFKQRVSAQRERFLKNEAAQRASRLGQVGRKQEAAAPAPAGKPEKAGDEIEISDEARKLVEQVAARSAQDDAARAERVKDLKARFMEGRLNTDALIARSVDKLLGRE